MTAFMTQYLKDLLAHAPYAPTQQAEFRAWSKQFAHWLFSTDHITVRYEISYDGVDIRKLSPGTRGIVLLLLYLALDDSDDRPLIIDQPEENLDPKSVFEELVSLFIAAKAKRQVIMVTHNANLVINTDADQIIVAEAGPHPSGGLPPSATLQAGSRTRQFARPSATSSKAAKKPSGSERAGSASVSTDDVDCGGSHDIGPTGNPRLTGPKRMGPPYRPRVPVPRLCWPKSERLEICSARARSDVLARLRRLSDLKPPAKRIRDP